MQIVCTKYGTLESHQLDDGVHQDTLAFTSPTVGMCSLHRYPRFLWILCKRSAAIKNREIPPSARQRVSSITTIPYSTSTPKRKRTP